MFHRREMLQIGCSSFFGLGLTGLLEQQAVSAANTSSQRAKSVVIVFLTGGGSHIDMFDPKPNSPETKGEFSPIDTRIPGVQFGELMTGMAQRADLLSVVRSMAHTDNRHLSGTHYTLTGSIQPFRGDSNQAKSLNRADWPCYGSAIDYLRPATDGLPSQVTLPHPLIEGTLVWPAQHAGFLGTQYDPFVLRDDPNKDDFKVHGLSLIDGLSSQRLKQRRQLLQQAVSSESDLAETVAGRRLNDQIEAAYSMLTSGRLRKAFRIEEEAAETRERYGRNRLGQTLLLARRMVEAEIPVIQCNMGIVQSWDTHVDHFPRLKTKLLPPTDQGVSALLDDLVDRGLLDSTLVIMVGEFGRTPRISPLANQAVPGRHHWAHGYTAVFAGAGVHGGQCIGKTDKTGGYPVTVPWSPADIGATVYDSLGIDLENDLVDRQGRARRLSQGEVMDVLFG
ncbi:MAG: DUF1501 domain-containing protein [Planctomycetota bacterium]|jgi:hypothetical protein